MTITKNLLYIITSIVIIILKMFTGSKCITLSVFTVTGDPQGCET